MKKIDIPESDLIQATRLTERFVMGNLHQKENDQLWSYFEKYPELLVLFEVEMA